MRNVLLAALLGALFVAIIAVLCTGNTDTLALPIVALLGTIAIVFMIVPESDDHECP